MSDTSESTEDWEARRAQDLLDQFGEDGVAEINVLAEHTDDPDDAVRAYRELLRQRGQGDPK